MGDVHLLDGEELIKTLRPHPLSFGHLYALPAALVLLAAGLWVLFHDVPAWQRVTTLPFVGDVGTPAAYVVWWATALLLAVISSVALVRWRHFFLTLGGIVVGTVLLLVFGGWRLPEEPMAFTPFWTALMGGVGLFMVELFRQSHAFHITSYRLVFQGGLASSHERTLRFAKITDVDGKRTFFGRLLGYGTIIPITSSGFGLGADTSFAGLGVGAGAEKGGVGGGMGVAAGGGQEVQTPKARTFYALHGVWPYKRTKHLIEELVQENTDVPYMKRQAETLERIERLLDDQDPDQASGQG